MGYEPTTMWDAKALDNKLYDNAAAKANPCLNQAENMISTE